MKPCILTSVHDHRRDVVFKIGDRVHWYEYSPDMIVVGGGYGIIVEIEKRHWPGGDQSILRVMKDGLCTIDVFPIQDCDLDEEWED